MQYARNTSRAKVYGSLLFGFVLSFPLFFSSKSVLAVGENIHPAACKATFLDQAFPMRWHEFYLMNPASNLATYVICPVQFEPSSISGNFGAVFSGSAMPGASSELPSCFFAANSMFNNDQQPYTSGFNRTFVKALPSQWVETGVRTWAAVAIISVDELTRSTAGDPVALSMFCKLPPGFSISSYGIG